MLIPVPLLEGLVSPFDHVVWYMEIDRPITRQEVEDCLRWGNLRMAPLPLRLGDPEEQIRKAHAGRIAYLAISGWHDRIQLDVGIDGYDYPWLVDDGNHRLAAAIFRRDAFIDADISGSERRMRELGLLLPDQPFEILEDQ